VENAAGFAFAWEAQALIAAGLVAPGVDAVRRAELLQLKFTVGRETIFPGIRRVLPGETIVVEGARGGAGGTPALPKGGRSRSGMARRLARLDAVLADGVGGASAVGHAVWAVPVGRDRQFGGAGADDAAGGGGCMR
jgi:asparagine synthase (glutamine-hydrolysing)